MSSSEVEIQCAAVPVRFAAAPYSGDREAVAHAIWTAALDSSKANPLGVAQGATSYDASAAHSLQTRGHILACPNVHRVLPEVPMTASDLRGCPRQTGGQGQGVVQMLGTCPPMVGVEADRFDPMTKDLENTRPSVSYLRRAPY